MPITTSMDVFVNNYHHKEMMMPKLPNDIIMNIIRMADGGLNTHKTKMKSIFDQFNLLGEDNPIHPSYWENLFRNVPTFYGEECNITLYPSNSNVRLIGHPSEMGAIRNKVLETMGEYGDDSDDDW
tara:strand:+ start:49 stop:426 length:378 start_codon:yes stop_codon:yes gene_type:complete